MQKIFGIIVSHILQKEAYAMTNQLIRMENDKILRKNTEICKTFNDYFVNITDELDNYNWGEDISYYSKLTSRMSVFNNHLSVRLFKNKYQQPFNFKSEFVFINQVLK